jgi:hypothetical protein
MVVGVRTDGTLRREDSTMSVAYEEAMKAVIADRLRAAAKARRARGLDR